MGLVDDSVSSLGWEPAESSVHTWQLVQGPSPCTSQSLLPTLSAASEVAVFSEHLLFAWVYALRETRKQEILCQPSGSTQSKPRFTST